MTAPSLTVVQVAERCGLSEKAVRGAIARGELTAYKPCNRLRVAEADLEAWLEACRVRPDPQPARPPVAPRAARGHILRPLPTPTEEAT